MKKFLKWTVMMSVCAVIFSMVMVSCGDDDDEKNDNNYKALIIGVWAETGYADEYDYGIIFREDGSFTEFDSGRYDGIYRISGNKLIAQYDNSSEEEVWTIKSLTNSVLVVAYSDYESSTYYRVTED